MVEGNYFLLWPMTSDSGKNLITQGEAVLYCDRPRTRELILSDEQKGSPSVVVTQQDIREAQLAKAPIRTGIQILLGTVVYSGKGIKQVIIAGPLVLISMWAVP